MSALIRPAASADLAAIDAVHRAAFPTDLEARLVALLIKRGKATISLVAEQGGQVVGHILFSPATHSRPHAPREEFVSRSETTTITMFGLGLAPVAILPAFQNQGLGSALVRDGLAECRRLAHVGPAGPAAGRSEVGGQRWDDSNLNSDLRLPPSDFRSPTFDDRSSPAIHWVVVLGHETYYPRFGFAPASRWNLTCDYGDTDAFQFLPLTAAADTFRGGHIRYAPEFGEIIDSGS